MSPVETTAASAKEEAGLEKGRNTEVEPFELLARTGPFGFMRRFSEEMDRLFEEVWGRRPARAFARTPEFEALWSPDIEVLEKAGSLVVRADLPGLTADDVKVEVTEEALVITGERKLTAEEKKEGFYRTERRYGSFYRMIPLPEGTDPEGAKASFTNGVLEIRMPLPKRAERKARRVEVK